MSMIYLGRCVELDGNDIMEMTGKAKPVTRRTFIKHVGREATAELEEQLGYTKGFTMASDWHVSYERSTFQSAPCFFVTWSCIEHVFINESDRDSVRI